MTRISLKEQYDNSSVVKQISDLTDQIGEYDEQIAEATETATAAKTTADAAKVTADSAAAKNTEQDSRLDSIESVNIAQEQEIAGAVLKNTQQDSAIAELSQEQDEQDAKIAAIQTKDTEQDAKIATIQAKDAEQDLSISSILDTDTKQDGAIDALKTITNTLTNEVISAVNVTDGTQNGSIMVRLTDTGGAVISSPSYPWGQVATFALKQGSEAGYVRGVLTLSDGEVIESNDYQILQIQESDVYVTSITLTPYPTTGKLGGEIGYSNGNVAQINVIDVPTAPGVTTNINDLLSRMGVVESGVNDLDVRVKAIEDTPGVGAFTNLSRGTILGSAEDGKVSANDDGTGSVSGWSDVVKSSQISDMLTKTDAASTYLTKTDAAAAYETLEGAEQISVVANEAKSTAEDAQSKANGCFSSVAVSTAGDGLTFGTPSGTTSDVTLPTSTKKLVVIDELPRTSFSLSGTKINTTAYGYAAGYPPVFAVRPKSKKIELPTQTIIIDELFPYAIQGVDITEYYYVYVFSDSTRNQLATELLANIVLEDGVYILSYQSWRYSSTTSLWETNNSVLSFFGNVKVTISDGEIIKTETVSTTGSKNFDVIRNEKLSWNYAALTNITKLS